jgi:N-acetylglucosamine-6-phosphate deacetylase
VAFIEDRQNITLADSKSTMNESIHVTSTELLTPDEDSQNTATLLATKILRIIEQYGLYVLDLLISPLKVEV